MLEFTKYIPEMLDEIGNAKKAEKIVLLQKYQRDLKLLLQLTYNKKIKPRFSRTAVKKILKTPYKPPAGELGFMHTHLFLETKKLPYFFEGSTPLGEKRLERLMLQLRDVLHPSEWDVVENVLLKKNLAKGLTEKLVREALPNLLPETD